MALGDAKSGRDVDPTLRPDSRLEFRRPGRQTHGVHRTQGIIFADGDPAMQLPCTIIGTCPHVIWWKGAGSKKELLSKLMDRLYYFLNDKRRIRRENKEIK